MRFLKLDSGGDLRLLKTQLDLTAAAVRATRLTGVLWSIVIALSCSDGLSLFGHRDIYQALYFPVLVIAMAALTSHVTGTYARATQGAVDPRDMNDWFMRILFLQVAVGLVWGMAPWLLWERSNPLNHVFLACCALVALSGVVIGRGSNMAMFLASLLPISLLTMARFALGGSAADTAIAIGTPLFALQMSFVRRPLVRRMQEDCRLRFQVEDLARELEETRDDALKKRFEAEAANASKTAFLANMSHELRTPLNAILGFSEIIAEECFGPVGSERYKDYAHDIHSSGAHLLSLINDLLDIAKIEAGRMEISPHPLDAARTFDLALKLLGAKAQEKAQTLTIAVDSDAPPLFADERALKQILINLVSNAVKFTPEGGRIEVLGARARDGGFQIVVKDNGPGIPRDKLDQIFSPFAQVDNRYDRQAGGTGLGLALVRGLAELHGGRAWIESEPGISTTAYVVLPVKRPDTVSAAA